MRKKFCSSFFLTVEQSNRYCISGGNMATKSKEVDKVKQELNEKPLNHLWHRQTLLRFPTRLKVMKCAKKTPKCAVETWIDRRKGGCL